MDTADRPKDDEPGAAAADAEARLESGAETELMSEAEANPVDGAEAEVATEGTIPADAETEETAEAETRSTAEPVAPKSRRPWLRSEVGRLIVAIAATAVLVTVGYIVLGRALIGSGLLTEESVTGPSGVSALYLTYWIVYCLAYTITTMHTFRRADGEALAQWFRESREGRRRRRLFELLTLASGPAGSVSLCIAALAAVIVFAISADQRGNPLLIFLTFLVVACSWMLILISYAVHYARENSNEAGLAFPGEDRDGPPVFSDYVYLAAQVATTFSTSDVTVERRSMRRTVTVHSIATFAYNTVVIALIVSMFLNATATA